MKEIEWLKLYGDEALSEVYDVEKYYFDDDTNLDARPMTYSYYKSEFPEIKPGFYPTFEINDVIIDDYGHGEMYKIVKYDRGFQEIYAERLNEDMKPTRAFTYLDHNSVFHKLKDVTFI